jgi:hypothetical protein
MPARCKEAQARTFWITFFRLFLCTSFSPLCSAESCNRIKSSTSLNTFASLALYQSAQRAEREVNDHSKVCARALWMCRGGEVVTTTEMYTQLADVSAGLFSAAARSHPISLTLLV